MKKIILILAAISLATVPVAAQETEATPEAPSGAPEEIELALDDNVALVDYSFNEGTLTLELYADRTTVVSIAEWPDSNDGASTSQFRVEQLQEETTTTVRIDTTEGVSLSTSASRQDGRQINVEAPGDAIIEGPYDGRDVMWAGISGALGVTVAVLYGAVAAVIGGRREGGPIA